MRIETIGRAASFDIECDGYVPMVIRLDCYRGPSSFSPKYWRTGDFKRTLLEVAVNPFSGELCRIALTSLSQLRSVPVVFNVTSSKLGLPVASMSQWADNQERIDVDQDVTASLVGRDLTVVCGAVDGTYCERIDCNHLSFVIDARGQLRGVKVEILSDQDVANIQFAIGATGQ
jgi:hypothetical protein